MKIVVVHGSPRKGNTFKATQIFKEEMQKDGTIEYVDFFLPKDLPEFCRGCMTCFFKGEEKCPHSEYTMPIMKQMISADALIFTTPVFVLSLSGCMKSFLDHFGYAFIVHRPRPEMFKKKAFILSSTAGAGCKGAIKTVSKSLKYWGVKRIYSYGFALFEVNWEEMNKKRQARIKKKIRKKAHHFYKKAAASDSGRPYFMIKMMFKLRRLMMKKEDNASLDKKYWIDKGWYKGNSNPFKT